jgi:hypothetical protein
MGAYLQYRSTPGPYASGNKRPNLSYEWSSRLGALAHMSNCTSPAHPNSRSMYQAGRTAVGLDPIHLGVAQSTFDEGLHIAYLALGIRPSELSPVLERVSWWADFPCSLSVILAPLDLHAAWTIVSVLTKLEPYESCLFSFGVVVGPMFSNEPVQPVSK